MAPSGNARVAGHATAKHFGASFTAFCPDDRLSRPRATVRKFPAHMNYAETKVSAMGFEPGTVGLRIQRTTGGKSAEGH